AQTVFTDAVPQTQNVLVSPSPTNSAPTITAMVKEVGPTAVNIAAAEFFIDATGADFSGTAMNALDGAFDSQHEKLIVTMTAAQFNGLSDGLHTVYVHGEDINGIWGPFASATFVKDTGPPTAAVIPSGTATNASPITFTITFSEVVTGLTAAGITVTNG